MRQTEELRIKGAAREVISRVQKLKKKGEILAADSIVVGYQLAEGSVLVRQAVETQHEMMIKAIRAPFLPLEGRGEAKVIVREEIMIGSESLRL